MKQPGGNAARRRVPGVAWRLAPLGALLLAAACLAQPAAAPPATAPAALPAARPGASNYPLLTAHGSADWLWVGWSRPQRQGGADVITSGDLPEFQTALRARPAGGAWAELPALGRPIVSMANRGSQLALLLDGGEWVLVSPPDVAATGQPIPVPRARLLAFGNDTREQKLWALASLPGGVAALPAPATRPATSPVSPATSPATVPIDNAPAGLWPAAGPALSLVSLDADGWAGEADVPPDIARPGDPVSFALIQDEHGPYLATKKGGEGLRLYRRDGGQWADAGAADVPPGRPFRLLTGTPRPVAWVAGAAGEADTLVFFDARGGARAVSLDAPRVAPPNQRTAAYATGQIRALYAVDRKLYEQAYDPATGAAVGTPLAVAWKTAPTGGSGWRGAVVVAALLVAVVAMFARRDADQPINLDAAGVRTAPLLSRALAGLIDAVPVFVAVVYQISRLTPGPDGTPAATDPLSEKWLWAGIVVYIAHTLVAELLTDRSLGKAVFGLRVVSLDGTRPKPGQIAVRNLLRVIDAGLLFLPALMVPFSPLHQRAGDAAAGTLVVGRGGAHTEPTEELAGARDEERKE